MSYVDGYVLAVPRKNREAYRKMAAEVWNVLRAHGAESTVEGWGDDVPDGQLTSFPMAVRAGADEVVVFSWIRWPSRAARDSGMKAAMNDPRLNAGMTLPVFDGKRMIFGGFEVLFEAGT